MNDLDLHTAVSINYSFIWPCYEAIKLISFRFKRKFLAQRTICDRYNTLILTVRESDMIVWVQCHQLSDIS